MKTLAVLLGGISPERYISYRSGWAVAAALEEVGYSVRRIDPARGRDCIIRDLPYIPSTAPSTEELSSFDPRSYIAAVTSDAMEGVDRVINMLHGPYGEDGTIQTLLDVCRIPYAGSRAPACRLAMDKARAKLLFSAVGIPTPPWTTIDRRTELETETLQDLREQFPDGIVIKPNSGGSTVGISIITSGNFDDIDEGLRTAWKYDAVAIVESYVHGREITVAILNDSALPVIEIVPQSGFYDYTHKYTPGMTEYIVPAEIDELQADFISTLAVRAHQVLGCSGITRVDFRLDEDGQAWCLEVNTIPGMTETSLVPKAASAAGINFHELCRLLAEL